MNEQLGFGMAEIKREGDIANPDTFTWECDLSTCEKCRALHTEWKQKYEEQKHKAQQTREKKNA
jgi:hypothetical protein